MNRSLPLLLLVMGSGAGCEWDFNRMIDQPSLRGMEATDLFSDGTSVQAPPTGTRPYAAVAQPAPVRSGRNSSGKLVTRIPVELDRTALLRGQERFQRLCAACHGPAGDGHSPVADHMTVRRPPSLLQQRLQRVPDGKLFAVMSDGYGLMPSYASALSVSDRWAVVGFVRALQLAQAVSLDELQGAERRKALRWLR